jgi:hypothetical protein
MHGLTNGMATNAGHMDAGKYEYRDDKDGTDGMPVSIPYRWRWDLNDPFAPGEGDA